MLQPICQVTPGRKEAKVQPKEVTGQIKRTYQQVTNANPFFVKRLTLRISVCQGCHGALRSDDGSIPYPPYDVCVAWKEKRSFMDVKTGQKKVSSTPCDTHYHIKLSCLPKEFDFDLSGGPFRRS